MARSISDEELDLKRRARRRLIGAIVLVTIIVVALPMVLDTEPRPISGDVTIKIPSPDSGNFTSRVVPIAPGSDKGTEAPAKPPVESKPAPKPAEKASAGAPAPKAAKPAETQAAASAPKPAAEQPARAESPKADPPAPKTAKGAEEPFVVQVIALADVEKAKQVQAQIAAAGMTSYTEVVKTVKGEVTRVRAGPFPTRAAAEKAQEQLKAIGLSGNVVPK